MKKGNGSASLGVLAEITGLLAAITADQFTAPNAEMEDGDHVVATANDDIKRLFVLRNRLSDKHNELAKSADLSLADLTEYLFKHGQHKAVAELEIPGSPMFEAEAKLKRTIAEMQGVGSLHKIVDGIFWLEVRRQHPDLEGKSTVGIRSDWSLVWTEDDDDDMGGIGIRVVGSGSLSDLFEMIGEQRPH